MEDIKAKVLEVFKKHNVDPKTLLSEEVKLAEAVLDNGQVIMTDAEEWGEGVPVFIEQDGERMALPDGEYALEDGTAIMVENGTIISWGAPQEEEMSDDLASRVAELEKGMAAMAEAVTVIMDNNDSAELKAELAKVKEDLSKKEEEIAKLKEAPVEKSALKKVQKVVVQKDFSAMTQKERAYHLFNQSKR